MKQTPKEVFDQNYHPGRLVELYWEDAKPHPKDKFFLIAAIKPGPILFVVNSSVNDFIQARPTLLQCQVTLPEEDYSFLNYDSYLNCSEAITTFKRSTIEDQILGNPKRPKSVITITTRRGVINAVELSDDIPGRHKQYIYDALGVPLIKTAT